MNDLVKEVVNEEDSDYEELVFDITEQISEERYLQGISRKELVKRLGTSPAYITKLLRGKNNFTIGKLLQISKVLDVELTINLQYEKDKTRRNSVSNNLKQSIKKNRSIGEVLGRS